MTAHSGMPLAREAAAVAEAAVAIAGGVIDPYTRELVAKLGRGELTGDQAAAEIIARFVPPGPYPRTT